MALQKNTGGGLMLTLIGFVILGWLGLKIPAIIDFLIHLKQFLAWKRIDLKRAKHKGNGFKYYGLKMFVGRQGSGKTISLVQTLNQYHHEYPRAKIYTNFKYKYATGRVESLMDLLVKCEHAGDDGTIFAFDEIQNEWSSAQSKDFPESMLSVITMQRKRKICILASSQVFTRVAKPLREQCYEVIECRTFFGRWTRLRGYDADDYNHLLDHYSPKERLHTPKKFKRSYIQTDDLRECYDTWEIVSRLSQQGFAEKVKL